jgi:hypothetical protein
VAEREGFGLSAYLIRRSWLQMNEHASDDAVTWAGLLKRVQAGDHNGTIS